MWSLHSSPLNWQERMLDFPENQQLSIREHSAGKYDDDENNNDCYADARVNERQADDPVASGATPSLPQGPCDIHACGSNRWYPGDSDYSAKPLAEIIPRTIHRLDSTGVSEPLHHPERSPYQENVVFLLPLLP